MKSTVSEHYDVLTEETAALFEVPVIQPLPDNVFTEPHEQTPIVAVCSVCGMSIRQLTALSCNNDRCPVPLYFKGKLNGGSLLHGTNNVQTITDEL